jgi:long-chain acyl-CoA synthetase
VTIDGEQRIPVGHLLDKFWLKHYPPGVPAEIDPGRYRSLKQLFEESFEKYRDRPGYTNMDVTLTYGDLDELSCRFGAW